MNSQTLKEKRNQTSRRILKAAADVFSEVGFDGARVDQIAKRAGVNKAMIYYHIGDKEALYAQVIHDVFGYVADQVIRNIKAAQSPQDKLKTYIRTLAGLLDQHPELAAIMLREQASGGKNLPEVIVKDLARIVGIISKILDEGTRCGVFIETVPFIVHLMIIGAIVLFKMSDPIRSKYPVLTDTLSGLKPGNSRSAVEEIEKLVLNAVRK
jgi:AcrR family transcriptional regulator